MNTMLKESYDVSNLYVKGLERHTVEKGYGYSLRSEVVYEIENQLSDEEKLEIVDYHTEGGGTYILGLIKDFEVAKENGEIIKKNIYGDFNKSSLLKFLRRVDPRAYTYNVHKKEKRDDNDKVVLDKNGNIVYDIKYEIYTSRPRYFMFGQKYLTLSEECPHTEYGYKMTYTGEPVVRQWFHDLLKKLNKEEELYFRDNDEVQVKINTVKELAERVGTDGMNNSKLSDLVWNNKRDGFTEEELDRYIEVLTDLVNTINEKKAQLALEV